MGIFYVEHALFSKSQASLIPSVLDLASYPSLQ